MSDSKEKQANRRPDHPEGAGGDDVHVLPVKLYLQIYGALLVLTVVTVGVSKLGLGRWGLASLAIGAALVVAIVKSGLVVGYFMHLKYDLRFYSVVFFSAVLFVGLFIGLTMVDLTTRHQLSREEGTFEKRHRQREQRKAIKLLKTAPRPMAPPAMAATPARPVAP